MGRRRRFRTVPLTSIALSINNLERIHKLKLRRETYDDFISRLLAEWEDLKDYRLDMDQVLRLKDRQISLLQDELKDKEEQIVLINQN